MQMWITKYALTKGIQVVEGNVSGGYFYPVRSAGFYNLSFKVGRDAHETETGARASADALRVKQIKSLEKKIRGLIAMKF